MFNVLKMSGLKGVTAMSIGNGSADRLLVTDLRVSNITLGGDIKFPNDKSLLLYIKDISDKIVNLTKENNELKLKLKEIQDKLETIE